MNAGKALKISWHKLASWLINFFTGKSTGYWYSLHFFFLLREVRLYIMHSYSSSPWVQFNYSHQPLRPSCNLYSFSFYFACFSSLEKGLWKHYRSRLISQFKIFLPLWFLVFNPSVILILEKLKIVYKQWVWLDTKRIERF